MNKTNPEYHGYIYLYKNQINNKMYIGQTSNLKQRKAQHKNKSVCTYPIDKAINKYGIQNFTFEILEEVLAKSYKEYKQKIDSLETFYIHKYRELGNTLYNLTKDGGGNTWAADNQERVYLPLSNKQKEILSASLRNYFKEHPESIYDRRGSNNPNVCITFPVSMSIAITFNAFGLLLPRLS